jgi:hypothetical protein
MVSVPKLSTARIALDRRSKVTEIARWKRLHSKLQFACDLASVLGVCAGCLALACITGSCVPSTDNLALLLTAVPSQQVPSPKACQYWPCATQHDQREDVLFWLCWL